MSKPNTILPPIAPNTPNYNSGSSDALSGSQTSSFNNKPKNNNSGYVGLQKSQRKMKPHVNKDLNNYTPFSISSKSKHQLKKQNYWSMSIDYDNESRSPIVSIFEFD